MARLLRLFELDQHLFAGNVSVCFSHKGTTAEEQLLAQSFLHNLFKHQHRWLGIRNPNLSAKRTG